MNLVELLEALGWSDHVTWRQRTDGSFARIVGRTEDRRLILDFQRPSDGVWIEQRDTWRDEDFLKAFEPVR